MDCLLGLLAWIACADCLDCLDCWRCLVWGAFFSCLLAFWAWLPIVEVSKTNGVESRFPDGHAATSATMLYACSGNEKNQHRTMKSTRESLNSSSSSSSSSSSPSPSPSSPSSSPSSLFGRCRLEPELAGCTHGGISQDECACHRACAVRCCSLGGTAM